MDYFPIFLTAKKLKPLVIGGGEVAARKIELLLKATNNISIVAKSCNQRVSQLIEQHQLTFTQSQYSPELLTGHNLVIAATDDQAVNAAIAEDAEQQGMLYNVVDQPELCSYITPALIDRSPMLIALSSSGSSPVLIRMLREQIEKMLPQRYGQLADFSFKFREHVKARIKGVANRRKFWQQVLHGDIGQMVLNGESHLAEQRLINLLNQQYQAELGSIVFIHTQDGEPDNLTLKAHYQMQLADCVFYDDEVNTELLEYVRRDAEKYLQPISANIMVNYQHALELAQQGQRVIYLLAGNPTLPPNNAVNQSDIHLMNLVCGSH